MATTAKVENKAAWSWSDKNMACVATYNILESDQLLNQFDIEFLTFDKAGEVKLSTLPYYPKYGGADGEVEAKATRMARSYFKYLLHLYTNRKENLDATVEEIYKKFIDLFTSKEATISALAKAADNYLIFPGEIAVKP